MGIQEIIMFQKYITDNVKLALLPEVDDPEIMSFPHHGMFGAFVVTNPDGSHFFVRKNSGLPFGELYEAAYQNSAEDSFFDFLPKGYGLDGLLFLGEYKTGPYGAGTFFLRECMELLCDENQKKLLIILPVSINKILLFVPRDENAMYKDELDEIVSALRDPEPKNRLTNRCYTYYREADIII